VTDGMRWGCPVCDTDVLEEMMNGHDCPGCEMPFKGPGGLLDVLCPMREGA
jgi:hypothetical protein